MSASILRPTRPTVPETDVQATAATTTPADSAQNAQLVNAEPASVEQAPAELTPAEPAAQAEPAPVKQPRVQVTKQLHIFVSPARVRRHFDKLGLNAAIDKEIKPYKQRLATFKEAERQLATGKIEFVTEVKTTTEVDGKTKTTKKNVKESRELTEAERASAQAVVDSIRPEEQSLNDKISALSRERVRFSDKASITLAIICDQIVAQLGKHAMDRVLDEKKKIIQVSHVHGAGVELLPLYQLFCTLPSFKKTQAAIDAQSLERAYAKRLADAVAKAEKDLRKKYDIKKKAPAAPKADHAEEADLVEEQEEDATYDSKTSFKFYVHQVCKHVIDSDVKYRSVRISAAIKNYLSDLLVEFIKRMSPLILETTVNMKNKTVNNPAIMRTAEFLLIDGLAPTENVKLSVGKVRDASAFRAEVKKRDDEKKAGRKYTINQESIAQIDGFVAARTVEFKCAGYDLLNNTVEEKLTQYKLLSYEEKKAVSEAN
jgi:hypothetical protein